MVKIEEIKMGLFEKKEKAEKKLSKAELKRIQEEQAQKAAEAALEAERKRLNLLTEKELLVEILMELRSYNRRMDDLEKSVDKAKKQAALSNLNSSMSMLNR